MVVRFTDETGTRHSLVDIGPAPALGALAHLLVDASGTSSRFVAEQPGLAVPLIGYFLNNLGTAGGLRAPLEQDDAPVGGGPRYEEMVAMVYEAGLPEDPHLAAAVGLCRVLLELAAEGRDVPSSALLGSVTRNLVTGVEDPTTLLPL